MSMPKIQYCPGTLAKGYDTYSRTCLRHLFDDHKVHHILPYDSPTTNNETTKALFLENQKHISISGVQEKFSVVLDKNQLRLAKKGERGTYILKPIPNHGENPDQLPANEHLTMQIAQQVYDIETAKNALVFFKNGDPAYITRRFDSRTDGSKWAKEDFASLAGRMPQTHGANYKYQGNYLELFQLMKKNLQVYKLEAIQLYKLLIFNYLFSNGDAHFKNFSILETALGDYRLSPAYDLLNTRIHVDDSPFALEDGLLPKHLAQGNVLTQFRVLAEQADIPKQPREQILEQLLSNEEKVKMLIEASFLNERTKRNYLQAYQTRLKRLKEK